MVRESVPPVKPNAPTYGGRKSRSRSPQSSRILRLYRDFWWVEKKVGNQLKTQGIVYGDLNSSFDA